MADEDLTPTPTQAESNEMVLAAVGESVPLGQPPILTREVEDLTPTLTQAENDAAVTAAAGAPPAVEAPVNVDVPYVGGVGILGGTLTCTMGNWEGEPTTYAYQWKSDAADVGTGAASYVVADTDVGHSITCVVTATNAAGSTTAPPSNAVVATVSAAARRAVPR